MLAASLFVLACAVAQDDRLDWVLDHLVALRTLDVADGDLEDLAPLAAAIGDARVVSLGEQSHGDGACFRAKARLIRFLHERLGFDVLAFESGLFDCSIAETHLRAATAETAHAAFEQGVFAIWTRSEACRPLFDYLRDAHAPGAAHPLELAGVDCQFTGNASAGWVDWIAGEAKELVVALSDDERAHLAKLYAQIRQLSTPPSASGAIPPPIEKAEAAAPFVSGLEARLAADDRRHRFAARTLRNLRSSSPSPKASPPSDQTRSGRRAPARRDHGREPSASRRSGSPGARSSSGREPPPRPRPAKVLRRQRDLYGSTSRWATSSTAARRCRLRSSHGGARDVRIGFDKKKARSSARPRFAETLRPRRSAARFPRPPRRARRRLPCGSLEARPFGYARCTGPWCDVADAFVYTAEMTPSTPREKAPAAK
jgi:hypothetical protein